MNVIKHILFFRLYYLNPLMTRLLTFAIVFGAFLLSTNVFAQTINGNYNVTGTVNVAAGQTLTVNGNLEVGGGATLNVYGTLIVTGNAILNSNLRIHPGGSVQIYNSLTVRSTTYLTVGTTAAAPPYADLVVRGNLNSQWSGDVTVNRNGRVAVFGNLVDDNGGGVILKIENGGQAYIHGNLQLTGGGSRVESNPTTPLGLYVGGTATVGNNNGSYLTPSRGDENTMQTTNPPFYNWVSGLPMSPLPVTLLYFTASALGDNVLLKWATASESNSKAFFIERSADGLNFTDIAETSAAGNSPVRVDYKWTDNTPLVGRSYYRLKQVDFDGTVEYFNVQTVDLNGPKKLSVYPNPLQGNVLSLELNFSSDEKSSVKITDPSGRVVENFQLTGPKRELPFAHEPGLYIITVQNSHSRYVTKLIVP